MPHTEVDLILVNSTSVDFGHRVSEGDYVSVYPVFECLDIAGLSRLRPQPLRVTRFVADGHLGTLARYLRLLGFDTRWDPQWDDRDLVRLSTHEQRVLLTRDRGLLKRRAVTRGFFVRGEDPVAQASEVVRRLHLDGSFRPFSRCMACNAQLEEVTKEQIIELLAPSTREHFNEFDRCQSCGRVYWKGSHHRRLVALVDLIKAEVSRHPADRDLPLVGGHGS